MTRPILVGEANPYHADPRFALYHLPRNASGDRIRQYLGLTDATYEAIDKANLCGMGAWSAAEARATVRAILTAGYPGTPYVVVALGRRVGTAFGVEEFFTATTRQGVRVVLLPHPSGLSRPWNDSGAMGRARVLLRREVPGVPWGEVP